MASPLSVVTRNRDFRNLFLAELVVFGADWFVMVPLLVLLPTLTGSGVWGALVLATDTGIVALLLPYTGTVADRVDRKKIMMGANLAALVAVLLLLGVRSGATAWLALVAIGAVAVAKAFYSPAAQAALPNVVDLPDLAAANAVAGSAWGTMTIVGASLGGVLSTLFGPYACFWIAAVALAGAIALAWPIRRPLQAPRDHGEPAQRTWAAIREALAYIGQRPRVLALVTVKSAVGLGNGVLTVFPLLAGLFGVGGIGTGLLFAVRGAGALVGPMLMRNVLTRRSWLLPGLAVSMSTYGLAYVGVSLATWFPLVLVLVFVAHVGGGGNWVMSNYALQGEVPDRLRGRVFATDMMLATLAVSASQLVVASMVDYVDERVVLAGCGLVTLVYAIGWRVATRRLSLADPVVEPAAESRSGAAGRSAGPSMGRMGVSFVAEPVRVSVPATSANLGPGFDALGLALALYDDVTARVTDGGCRVEVTGEGAGELPTDEQHLVVRAMHATFDVLGGRPAGLAISCVNRIPQARGLGSSSAAIVAGVRLARALVTDGAHRLDDAGMLRLAARLEGHPDNVAPCLLGGFTIAWTEAAGARAVTMAPAPAVQPTVFIPDERGLTTVARAALPATVPHADAALTAGRAALLVHALTAEPALLLPATEDRLHQDYRAEGMPGTAALVAALRDAGVAAVVSGAGPSVLALTAVPQDFPLGMGWAARALRVDVTGARIEGAILGHAERDPVAAGRKS